METPRGQRVRSLAETERHRLSKNDGVNEVFARLRADAVQPYDAILVVEELFGLPFDESKRALANSPAYAAWFKHSELLHDAAEEAWRQLEDE